MPFTVVNLVLHRKLQTCVPDIITTIISDFLIADLPLAQACEWTHIGSTFLLDLVWMRSLRDVKNSKWTLAKLLQSEPDYYQWAFSQSLTQAVRRGDLVMVQWLLTHFSGCSVSQEVVEEAARGGNLWVLQLLEADKRHGGIEWSDKSVDEAARIGNWELVKWLLKRTRSTRETRRANDDVVNSAFEQNNLVQVKWAIEIGFGVTSIMCSDCTELEWQCRAEILRYLLNGRHVPVQNIGGVAVYRAARFGDLDFLEWVVSQFKEQIDVQYWTHALENASESGHLSVMQWILTNVDGVVRGNGSSDAMFAAAENGKLEVVQWLYKQYGGKLKFNLFQERDIPSDIGDRNELPSDDDLVPTTAMDAAVKTGHLVVLQYLDDVGNLTRNKQRKRGGKLTSYRQVGQYPRCTAFAMDAAAACGNLNVVKWLHSHRSEGCTTAAMDRAAGNGHLNVVQWLHSHRMEGCTTAAMDMAAARRFHVPTCDGSNNETCCLRFAPSLFFEKQLEVLQWLHTNRSEGCTSAAMDGAAANGNLKMMKWLYENSTVSCTIKAANAAARLGRLDGLEWLQKYSLGRFTAKTMNKAAAGGHLKVVRWLHQNRYKGNLSNALIKAAARGHLHVVRWILRIIQIQWPLCSVNDTLVLAMKQATISEHFELILFLEHHLHNYTCSALREMRYQWFHYYDIQRWFLKKYSHTCRKETHK